MEYIYEEGAVNQPIFLLLHGTGGDERDLLPVAEAINSNYGVLSVRGQVREGGMNRFFKRKGLREYDLESLKERGKELYEFIEEKSKEYNFELENLIPLGFSNGANIAIQMILEEEVPFKRALLFAAMFPVDVSANTKDLSGLSVFMSAGKVDPIVSQKEVEHVQEIFKSRGANLETFWVRGHQITSQLITAAHDWLEKQE